VEIDISTISFPRFSLISAKIVGPKKEALLSRWTIRIRMRFLIKSDIYKGRVRVFAIYNNKSKVKCGSRKIIESLNIIESRCVIILALYCKHDRLTMKENHYDLYCL
jgi:hypothetical protein